MILLHLFFAQLENQTSRPHVLASDPRRLRRWLREMETDIAKSPTLSAAMKMKPAELRKRLKEHSVSEQHNFTHFIPHILRRSR